MYKLNEKTLAGTLLACAILSGCGGGGSPSATVGPSAEGVYGGTLTGSTSTSFQLLVLENGDFWSVYGSQSPGTFGVAGFVQGTGTSNNGSFTSSNSKDFGFSPALAAIATATYDATAKTIAGNFKAGTTTVTFAGGPIAGSLYDYNAAASLTTVVGAWSTTSLTGEGVALKVASSGAFTAMSSLGCSFTGTIAPRASGKNVFNVSTTFGGAPCALPGQSATGIAIAYPLSNGMTQLLVAATDSTRSYGAALFGSR